MDAAFAPPPDDKFCFDVSAFSASNFAPAAFVGKLRADGVDLTKLRADLTRHHAALTKSYQASLRAELPQLAKLTGALGATDAELRRLCDRLAAHEEAASEHAAAPAPPLAAADAKRAEHAALAARAAQLRVLQRFADSLRTLEWLLGAEPDAIDLKAHEAVAAGGGSGAPPPRLLCDAERLLRAGRELGRLEKLRASGAALVPVAAAAARADACRATLVEKSLSCLAAALHLGAKAEKPIHTGPALDVLHGLADAGCADEVQRWVRSDWVAPTLGPKLRTAAEAPEAVAAPLTGVCAAARAYLASDGAALLSHPDLATRQPALHLLASSFWAEVVDFITQEMPQVFGAGIPDAFQRNYLLLARLQAEVEGRLHGAEQLQAFREAPHTAALAKRWSLPIYYQLRAKHISEALDASLPPPPEPIAAADDAAAPAAAAAGEPAAAPAVRTAAAAAAAAAIRAPFAPTSTSLHCRRG